MPLQVLTELQRAAGMAALEEDFAYLLSERLVPEDVRAILGFNGIIRLTQFARLKATKEEFEKWVVGPLGVPNDTLRDTGTISSLIEAWATARDRGDQRRKVEAEAKAHNLPVDITVPTYIGLVQSYEKANRRLSPEDTPAKSYIEARLEQLEDGNLRAKSM